MVQAVFDPIKIPTITLSPAEIIEIEGMIEGGALPKDWLERYWDVLDAAVFGEDAPKDRHGHRKEQGLGSPGNQTPQSVAAYQRWHSHEPGYEEHLKRLQNELAKSNEKRAASAPKRYKGRR